MASRKENLKALFSNTRSRVIILFTGVVLLFAVVFGVVRFTDSTSKPEIPVAARVGVGPVGIESIPGAIDPTEQYAGLVHEHNIQQAQQAEKTGGSAIPTIIRAHEFGKGIEAVGPLDGKGGLGFIGLEREDAGDMQKSEWIQSLKNANCSKASMEQIVNQGATIHDLKQACSCAQLKDNGYVLEKLKAVCSCKELKAAGFNALQFKNTGYSAGQLRVCGFDACQLRNAGYTAQQMKDGGFTDGELKGAGYPDSEIQRASGLPAGITPADIRDAGCGVEALEKLRASGVSAAAIRRISGCSAEQLKAAGYTAQDLRNAGFSAAALKDAGFSAAQLRNAGYSARDLLNAGFTPAELAAAGYSPAQIKSAEAELPPGVTPEDIKEAGCSVGALTRERLAGISAAAIHRYAGCTAKELKAAGFTNQDLANAGFTPAQIKAADEAVDDAAIRAAGCNPEKLSKLREEGVTAKQIRDLNGCTAAELKAAGYDAQQLLNAGFTPQQLLAAGFTPAQVKAAEEAVGDDAIRAAGCNPEKLSKLREEGVSAKRIRDLNGCTAAELKAAGYDAKQLLNAGFTPQQLLAAGFTPAQIKAAEDGVDDAAIRAAGCNPEKLSKLREEGVTAKQIRDLNGCTAAELKAAGYDAKQLANAGFTPQQLLAAGFTPEQLAHAGLTPSSVIAVGRTANCSVASLKAAHTMGVSATTIRETLGCSAKAMEEAGYTAAQLRNAGFTAAELKNAGFTAAQLKQAGFTAKELADAGFTAQQLRAAGFSAEQLKNAGLTASQLRAAGLSAKDLKEAGYTPGEIEKAGYSKQALEDAGISDSETDLPGLPTLSPEPTPPSDVAPIPSIDAPRPEDAGAQQARNLQKIMEQQKIRMADQRYQQKLQQVTSAMLSSANQSLQDWKSISTQRHLDGKEMKDWDLLQTKEEAAGQVGSDVPHDKKALIKTGDVMFAVLDTSVNSDQPSPILATIVSGKFKGAKLIGSFTLPTNSDRVVISFNTMSVPGASSTTAIHAYAIDPNTGRTALADRANHHYLMRYGSLFASTFLEGFGNAFQSANTTITIGGTGGVQTTSIESGIGRSILENAVIGLATLGKNWGQVAHQNFNRPTTVEVCSGMGMGILFTQDVRSL